MNILLVDDDSSLRKGIALFLQNQGHTITECENGCTAFESIKKDSFDLILTDDKMPDVTGTELLSKIHRKGITIPVILMTAYANVEGAVHALKLGAIDYLNKPLSLDELQYKINRIQCDQQIQQENRQLKQRLRSLQSPDIIGKSPAIQKVKFLLERIATDTDAPIMILGESGTGKELVARTLHNSSVRKNQPFIAVNCSAFQESLLESELFGHVKGAFTGAYRDKDGIFKQAHQGTLFLDEVGEMSLTMQPKLLRVLQERTFQPVGSSRTMDVDVRIFCASNIDLKEKIGQGQFREDLYYRLNVVEVALPPLRERIEDIPLLIEQFIHKYDGDKTLYIHPKTMDRLQQYAWPGNIRELENLIRMFLAISSHQEIIPEDLPEKFKDSTQTAFETINSRMNLPYKQALEQTIATFERDYLNHHLKDHDNNISHTASTLGISRAALHQKIKKYDLL